MSPLAVASGRRAVVAGGGPVGTVAALMLAQQGWHVQVFDQAGAPALLPTQNDNRAYRLSLMPRALRVLKLAHIDISPLVGTQGGLLEATWYKPNGQVQKSTRLPVTDEPLSVRAFRDEIALLVVKEAQRQFPEAITFHFNTPVSKIDLNRQTVVTSPAGSSTTEVPYDLLVGADGSGSAVRAAVQQIMPPGYIRRYKHKQVYSMLQVTPSQPKEIAPHTVLQAHILPSQEGMVLWDGRGSSDCRIGLTLPQEHADELREGKTDRIVHMLEGGCPAMPSYARQAVLELVHSKPQFYPMPSWTHLSQLHGPKVVLLGDAAHTMTPVGGQGLNSGLEDVAVFAQCLEQHQGNVDTALPAYNTARLPDVKALMTMNEVMASNDAGLACQDQDLGHELWLKGHKALLILHFLGRMGLQKVAPKLVAGPAVMQIMMGTLPYRSFKSALYSDGLKIAGFLVAASALVVYGF